MAVSTIENPNRAIDFVKPKIDGAVKIYGFTNKLAISIGGLNSTNYYGTATVITDHLPAGLDFVPATESTINRDHININPKSINAFTAIHTRKYDCTKLVRQYYIFHRKIYKS